MLRSASPSPLDGAKSSAASSSTSIAALHSTATHHHLKPREIVSAVGDVSYEVESSDAAQLSAVRHRSRRRLLLSMSFCATLVVVVLVWHIVGLEIWQPVQGDVVPIMLRYVACGGRVSESYGLRRLHQSARPTSLARGDCARALLAVRTLTRCICHPPP